MYRDALLVHAWSDCTRVLIFEWSDAKTSRGKAKFLWLGL